MLLDEFMARNRPNSNISLILLSDIIVRRATQIKFAMKIDRISHASSSVLRLLAELNDYTNGLYPSEFNELDSFAALQLSHVLFLGATVNNQLIGCGAAKNMGGYAELKRLYVSPEGRGKGVATILLQNLENHVITLGFDRVFLETGIYQHEAMALYRLRGYTQCEPFGAYSANPYSVFYVKGF